MATATGNVFMISIFPTGDDTILRVTGFDSQKALAKRLRLDEDGGEVILGSENDIPYLFDNLTIAKTVAKRIEEKYGCKTDVAKYDFQHSSAEWKAVAPVDGMYYIVVSPVNAGKSCRFSGYDLENGEIVLGNITYYFDSLTVAKIVATDIMVQLDSFWVKINKYTAKTQS